MAHMEEDLIDSREAAQLLGLSIHGVNMRRRDGKLTAARRIGASYLFRRADVLAQPRVAPGRRGPKPAGGA
jgi:hypothetical protein